MKQNIVFKCNNLACRLPDETQYTLCTKCCIVVIQFVIADLSNLSNSSCWGTLIGVRVRILVMTFVFFGKPLNYNYFSSPRSKWVPVRAEMVLVIDLAWCATYMAAQAVYSQGSWDGLQNEINGPVTRGNNVGEPWASMSDEFEHYVRSHHYYYFEDGMDKISFNSRVGGWNCISPSI